MKLVLIRAALAAALSIFFLDHSCLAKAPKSETHKDIIEKAYNLSLQRDRQQAIRILVSAIKRETRPQNISELKKTLSEIANVFFSDKAQQLYESGVSLQKADLSQALEKLNEASRIEPDNFTILNQLSRLLIAKGDCKGAQDVIQAQLNSVNFDEDLKLSLAQALTCQGKWTEYQRVVDSVVIKKSLQQKFWLELEAEKLLAQKSVTKARETLTAIAKIDEKYPEISYWSWKLSQILKKKDAEEAHKYLMMCKNISASLYRQYMIDPMLCRRVPEVEAELKGMNGSSE
ncbi:MAG: tetratricopeptide repeat protein [Bdellovibrio sp.]